MSTKKEIWAHWDRAWSLGLPAKERLSALQAATSPNFRYVNPQVEVPGGNLEQLVQFIDQEMVQTGNKLTVKHIKWREHHDQSALQWEMIDVETKASLLPGWSCAQYDAEGKLLSVADFF